MARKVIEVNENFVRGLKDFENLSFEEFQSLTELSYPTWRKLYTGTTSQKWFRAIEIAKDENLSMAQKIYKIQKIFEPKTKKTIKKPEGGKGQKKKFLSADKAYLALKYNLQGKNFKEIAILINFEGHWKTLESIIMEKRYDTEEVALYFKGIKKIETFDEAQHIKKIYSLIAELEKLTGKKVMLVDE